MSVRSVLVSAINGYVPKSGGGKRGPLPKIGSRRQLAKDSGVAESQLSRLISGKQGITLDTLETLCDHLNLELRRIEDA